MILLFIIMHFLVYKTRLWLHLWMSVSFSGLSSEFVDAMLKMFIGPLVPVFFWTPQVPSIIFTLEKKDKIKGIQPFTFLDYFWVGITILLVIIDFSARVGLWFDWVGQKTNNCVFWNPLIDFLLSFIIHASLDSCLLLISLRANQWLHLWIDFLFYLRLEGTGHVFNVFSALVHFTFLF